MKLSSQDADLFFKLMWAAQFYVNRRLALFPEAQSVEAHRKLPHEDKHKVRNALWEHIALLDDFVKENPDRLSPEELRIVQGWKKFISGNFYIFRYLKRYTIFIAAQSPAVYAVLGLYDSLRDVLPGRPLPVYTQAVLLPFKGTIVYDGLLLPYSIFFGPGIRGDLNETYQRAKQQDLIIETLEEVAAAAKTTQVVKAERDWGPVVDQIVEQAERLRQPGDVVQNRAFGVLKASAKLAQAAAHAPDDLDELWQIGRSVTRALRQLETALDRAR